MSDDPDAEHVVSGLPPQVVTEVERLAGEMVALAEVGVDVTDLGEGPRRGVQAEYGAFPCSSTAGAITLGPKRSRRVGCCVADEARA